jgi:predicted MFS family arabinose efflux permease
VPAPPWSLYNPRQRWKFLAVLFLVTTSNYFDNCILSILLEPIKHEFGVSDTMLGLLSGFVFALVYAVAGLPIARWADRGNRRTVITLALTGWSVMTTLCGFAQTFWQLALARFGLGAAAPGAMPPAQALIADYFPPAKRATASAILNAGTAAGYLAGIGLGGYVAATHGWRSAFILAGALGLVLAGVARLTLVEPRNRIGFPFTGGQVENLGQAFLQLQRKRTFLYALAGISVYTIFAFGFQTFLPSFMIRTLHGTLAQVSLTWAIAISAANLVGALVGGSLADRLSKNDIRWVAWLPALACALAMPIYGLALAADNLWSFIVIDCLADCIVTMGMSVCFVSIHSVCGQQRRTTAIAIVQLSFVLSGGGFGPLIAGALSDALSVAYGPASLRYSLMAIVLFLAPAAVVFYAAGRTLPQEQEA